MNRNHKKNNRRIHKTTSRVRQRKLLGERKHKLNIKNIIKLLLVILLMATLYVTFTTKKETEQVIDNLDQIIEKLENIQNEQNTLNEKQTELEEKQKALEIAKAEKKEAEEKAKKEAEEKKKQEAIKVAQVTSRGSVSTRGSSSTPKATGTKAEYQAYAKDLCLNTYGWSEYDFECLVKLWNKESGWNPNAHNKSSGAHGIPQSLPASKMSSEGADYYTNGKTQIRWGLKYIKNRYGTPAKAWAHSQKVNWY
ncbi:transglycosylase SLT domain-containing protein [uncultured Clostridium sp.]|uniref:aggregation-promoting factor C-terminal-like domain-containing protein n=1 Tax=uncultured Clostridium sp. TaxID=59620 RepID=UPI0026EFF0A1|nr:transglycosylase SLT domain-containing protein [uncultured Clostridium sp.]